MTIENATERLLASGFTKEQAIAIIEVILDLTTEEDY